MDLLVNLWSGNSFSQVKRYSILFEGIALIGDGVLGDYTNLPCGWDYCITLHQNLLQQRALCESVTPDIDYYSNSVLLDDKPPSEVVSFHSSAISFSEHARASISFSRSRRRSFCNFKRRRGGVCSSYLPTGSAKIKVVGVGGGGNNAVNRMIGNGLQGMDFYAINTDAQALLQSAAKNPIQIGEVLTRGLGTGGSPLLGEQAAEESKEAIANALKGSDMVFNAGLGWGYGFCFEGRKESVQAGIADAHTSLQDAFLLADDVLRQIPGLVNVDFADVRAVIKDSGTAMLGVGISSSKNRAEQAAEQATLAPLIGSSIQSATGVVYNITGGKDITLQEVNRVSQVVTSLADPSANIIFGAVVDERFNGEIHVTLIATGFPQSTQKTFLTDPMGAKLADKITGNLNSKKPPVSLSSSTSSSRMPARKLFFLAGLGFPFILSSLPYYQGVRGHILIAITISYIICSSATSFCLSACVRQYEITAKGRPLRSTAIFTGKKM
ncbi:UNVERIFIED_CONTAM: Cell division protein FtsZ1, chloroplastic [Sesamum angustifolium]|uniref:Cell division protein FtsZ1, chloroplastic n=1 Tax=Sesamum angustifolium TaxID=2727405 RepID=A0AAW2PGG3_9LAMI